MTTICIGGSPRNACTEHIMRQVSTTLGAKLILLRQKNLAQCKGCMSCLKNPDCVIKDDTQQIINEMGKSDLIIFGVPNYFNNVTGLFKNFIDRLLPLYKNKTQNTNNALKQKKVVFIYVGGGGEDGTEQDVYNALHNATSGMVKYLDLNVVGEFPFVCSETHDIKPQQAKVNTMIEKIKTMEVQK